MNTPNMANSCVELHDDTRSDCRSEINNYDGVQYYDDCRFMTRNYSLPESNDWVCEFVISSGFPTENIV